MWISFGSCYLELFALPGAACVFSIPIFLSFPSGTVLVQTLFHLILSYRYLKLSSLFKCLFSLCCSVWVISTSLSSRSPIHSSTSSGVEKPDLGAQTPHSSGQAPHYEIPPDCGSPCLRWDFLWDCISTSPTPLGVGLFSFVVEALFSQLSGPFLRKLFMGSCRFVVFVE